MHPRNFPRKACLTVLQVRRRALPVSTVERPPCTLRRGIMKWTLHLYIYICVCVIICVYMCICICVIYIYIYSKELALWCRCVSNVASCNAINSDAFKVMITIYHNVISGDQQHSTPMPPQGVIPLPQRQLLLRRPQRGRTQTARLIWCSTMAPAQPICCR